MLGRIVAMVGVFLVPAPFLGEASGPDLAPEAVRPLRVSPSGHLRTFLPKGARLLDAAVDIEAFLAEVDGAPPDWAMVHGSDGQGHDERLFALNRQRDRLREGSRASSQLITFLWPAELSSYNPQQGGFHLAIGPKMIPTTWGLVRFKPDGLPANLVAIPPPGLRKTWRSPEFRAAKVEIMVAMTGRLLTEESIIYDFAHEEPGRGLVMPVVRVERVDYFLVR
jgi:hypothetical protein